MSKCKITDEIKEELNAMAQDILSVYKKHGRLPSFYSFTNNQRSLYQTSLNSSTPEGKYLRKQLSKDGVTIRRGQLLSIQENQIRAKEEAKKRKFSKDNKEEIARQKRLIKNFRNMFRDDGIEICFSNCNTFNGRQKIVRIFDEYNLSQALEDYAVLHELKNNKSY